jgi:hypothetical protein
MSDKPIEVISWDPADHTELPGFAHGLTRYGRHWMDIEISTIPVDVDPLEALDKVFARLREMIERHVPDPQYFTVDLRVVSKRPLHDQTIQRRESSHSREVTHDHSDDS